MFFFVLSIILFLVALIGLLFFPTVVIDRMLKTQREVSIRKMHLLPFGLGLLLLVISMFTVVGPRNAGVETFFKAPTGRTLDAGLTFKAPWNGVTDIDGSIQPEEYKGDSCIYVKIADGGSACVSAAYRWRINPAEADRIYQDYRGSDQNILETVRSSLVTTNMKASINEAFASFDPLGDVNLSSDMTAEELASAEVNVVPDYQMFNELIEEKFAEKITDVGDLISLQSVTVSYLKLPEKTQSRIDAFNQAVQNTKISLQEVATKEAQAEGNVKLAESLQDPNVLVSKCLDALAAGDFTPPAGFSCWPGGGGSVVIPSSK